MHIRSGCAVVLTSLLFVGQAHAAPPSAPSRSELSLAGLKIDDSLAVVREKLGKPESTVGAPGDPHYILIYRGLRIEMTEPGQVLMLESTSSRYCTPSGLCPGQSLDEARKRWGQGETYEGDSNGTLNYSVEEDSCFLQIEPDSSQQFIHSVSFACP